MSKQKIEDYLTKQLFISKNIVTYRSLSREFGIHVNTAKNELAAFHAKSTKSPDQTCSATYLISGEYPSYNHNADKTDTKSKGKDVGYEYMDIDLEPSSYEITPTPTQSQSQPGTQVKDFALAAGGGSGEKDGGRDSEVVVQIRMTVVGEAGFEDAKAKYVKVNSVHVYSLSPAPIRDADFLCEPSRRIREVDNQKGVEIAKAVGRIIGEGIEMKAVDAKKKGRATGATTLAKPAIAAPKLKAAGASAPTSTTAATASTKAEEKAKELAKDEPKKPKQTGKINFAPKPQAQVKEKEKDNSAKGAAESKSKMFFGATSSSKSTASSFTKEKAPVSVPSPPPPPPPKEEKSKTEPVKRGTKRKSTAAILSDEEEEQESTKPNSTAPSGAPSRQSSNPPSTRSSPQPARAMSRLRIQRNTIVSDEEDDEQPRKKFVKKPRRKATHVSDAEDGYDSDVANEAARVLKSMMDIDDDQVEKVSRKVKIEPPRREEEEEEETELELKASVTVNTSKDEDVDMSDGTEVKPKPKPRKKKEKKVAPVGRNGLKKRRVMKSRMRVDEKGYMVTEDYSSYESVGEEEEEEEEAKPKKAVPAKKGSGGKRVAGGRKEKEEVAEPAAPEDTAVSASTPNSEPKSKTTAKAAASSAKPSTNKTATKSGQKQKTLNTFFGPPKVKK